MDISGVPGDGSDRKASRTLSANQHPIIRVRNLSKAYKLRASPNGDTPLGGTGMPDLHWALRDVSLDIMHGETFGILGVNGSGKSTLLQIIAGILTPTSGSVTANGRICPLLQLGAGFSPQFSGRENARLNAAILGMSTAEIDAVMDSIEAFADVGEYFDQPVRTYSSGMFARVAFATAIHSQPDILVVDEILAVGDVRFQSRCFRRIRELQDAGKTILLVTHDTSSVVTHCQRAVLLDAGHVVSVGSPSEIVDLYIARLFGGGSASVENTVAPAPRLRSRANPIPQDLAIPAELSGPEDASDHCAEREGYNSYENRFGPRDAEIVDYLLRCEDASGASSVLSGSEVTLDIKVLFKRDVDAPIVGYGLKTLEGTYLHGTNSFMMGISLAPMRAGTSGIYRFVFRVPLSQRTYLLDLGAAENDGTPGGRVLDVRRASVLLTIHSSEASGFDGLMDLDTQLAHLATSSATQGGVVWQAPEPPLA